MKKPIILTAKSSADYELLDSGEGEKLERFGKFVLSRPDPQALWRKHLPEKDWKKADGRFGRNGTGGITHGEGSAGWELKKDVPARWQMEYNQLKFWIKPTPFKHVGLFPEQAANWEWMRELIKDAKVTVPGASEIQVLNLFGYSGGATLACAQAGAKVVHIDGSKSAVAWARENAELSGLRDAPIRWIVEDARTFVERELRRGRTYDGIIMDPPSFGHGPDSELWKIEEHFLSLVENCVKLLKVKPLFFLINGYASGYSAIAYENVLLTIVKKFGGHIEIGELAIEEKGDSRLLPAGIFARWAK